MSADLLLLPPRVVLLEPKRGANVGAVCRAIKNMGAESLVLVGGEFDAEEAGRTSVHARDVFASRREVSSFEDAVSGCGLIVGTTSRNTPWNVPVLPIREVARQAFAAARHASVTAPDARSCALVFGREDRGLSNQELARCHRLAYVPTADEYTSLNLAQAAVICLYEWFVTSREEGQTDSSSPPPSCVANQADAASVSAALEDLRSTLIQIGFLSVEQPDRVMATIASLLTRSGLDEREVRIVRGIARQMRWFAGGGAAVAEARRAQGRKLR